MQEVGQGPAPRGFPPGGLDLQGVSSTGESLTKKASIPEEDLKFFKDMIKEAL